MVDRYNIPGAMVCVGVQGHHSWAAEGVVGKWWGSRGKGTASRPSLDGVETPSGPYPDGVEPQKKLYTINYPYNIQPNYLRYNPTDIFI